MRVDEKRVCLLFQFSVLLYHCQVKKWNSLFVGILLSVGQVLCRILISVFWICGLLFHIGSRPQKYFEWWQEYGTGEFERCFSPLSRSIIKFSWIACYIWVECWFPFCVKEGFSYDMLVFHLKNKHFLYINCGRCR